MGSLSIELECYMKTSGCTSAPNRELSMLVDDKPNAPIDFLQALKS